jgi:hypothetical protein
LVVPFRSFRRGRPHRYAITRSGPCGRLFQPQNVS